MQAITQLFAGAMTLGRHLPSLRRPSASPLPRLAVAGDYVVSMRASGDGISESANYRVAVTTSTLFGLYGLGFIAVALLVLFGAVGRFGRR